MLRFPSVKFLGLAAVAVLVAVLGATASGGALSAHAGVEPETLQCADLFAIPELGPMQACIALDPQTGTNPLGSDHTVTATITRTVRGVPVEALSGFGLYVFIIKGPNAGERVVGVTDANGQIALTYTGDGGEGTDQFGTEACLSGNFCAAPDQFIDGCVADPDPCIDTFFQSPTCDGSVGDDFICDNATKDWVPAATPEPTNAAEPTSAAQPTSVPVLPSTGTSAGSPSGNVVPWLVAALAAAGAVTVGSAAWYSRRRLS